MESEDNRGSNVEQDQEQACSIKVFLRVKPSIPSCVDLDVRAREGDNSIRERQDVG